MTNWRLVYGLQNLRGQVDGAFPLRDRTSDGTIGDAAHMAETSGHNPDDTAGSKPAYDDRDGIPEVRAWDMDSDLNEPGVTTQAVVNHIRALPNVSSVIRYIIYNRTMYHSRDGFAPTPYTGASAHTEHVHFEGAWTQAADNNTTFDFHLGDLVTVTDAEVQKIADAAAKAVWYGQRVPNTQTTGGTYVRTPADLIGDSWSVLMRGNTLGGDPIPPGSSLAQIRAQLNTLAGKDFTDEPAIAAAVLAGLTPEKLGAAITAAGLSPQAIADALPAELAGQLIDVLAQRLGRPVQ